MIAEQSVADRDASNPEESWKAEWSIDNFIVQWVSGEQNRKVLWLLDWVVKLELVSGWWESETKEEEERGPRSPWAKH